MSYFLESLTLGETLATGFSQNPLGRINLYAGINIMPWDFLNLWCSSNTPVSLRKTKPSTTNTREN
jgi:hypothetical protein